MTVASAACLGQARATAALRPRRGAGCRAWERTARRVVTADADARVSDATRVVRLDDGPGGATLHLVGVSHVLVDDAARDIRALMRRLRPDAVVLELCAERAPAAMAAALAGVSADTAPPPAVIPRAVRIEGLPSKPLPGASEAELLSLLRARAGAVVTPRDLARDRDALMALGHFREVDVDILDEDADAVAAAPALVAARLDSTTDTGFAGTSIKREPLTEVIAVRSVELRVAPNAAAAVTADIRFSWGRRARRAFGARASVERKIVRGALQMLLQEEEEEEGDDDGDDDEEDAWDEEEEEASLWEGVALRSALGASARASCPGASVDVVSFCGKETTDSVDEGGVVWVRVALDGERTFPHVGHSREEAKDSREDSGSVPSDAVPTRTKKKSTRENEHEKVSAATRVARVAETLRSVSSMPGETSLAARAYLAASELAQELVAARLDQKAPAGAETVAALASAMAAGARAVVLGDVPASETLAGVVEGLEGVSLGKTANGTATATAGKQTKKLGSVLDASFRLLNSVFASDKGALRNDVAAALRGFVFDENESRDENENGRSTRELPSELPPALTDALVTRRDARLFDAAWCLAERSAGVSVPAYARVKARAGDDEETEKDDSEALALYALEKAWDPSGVFAPSEASFREGAMVIVAVVGAAHVEGIARRWREKSAKERKRE
jgi:hypothetical protein